MSLCPSVKIRGVVLTGVLAGVIVALRMETAMSGWYLDSIKTAPILEIRGETADTAKLAGDRYVDDNLDYLLANNQWVIVNFCAYWCGDCNNFMPHYERAARKREYAGIRWATADVDGVRGNETLHKRFNLPGTPTVILFRNGQIAASADGSPAILDGHEGDKGYGDLIALLKSAYAPK